jgi:hypothetical protein
MIVHVVHIGKKYIPDFEGNVPIKARRDGRINFNMDLRSTLWRKELD